MRAEEVFLSLGSNLGDRLQRLEQAEIALAAKGFETHTRSAVYETEPVGGPVQGDFLNRVLRGNTALSPRELLHACLEVEREAGRVRQQRNGPRTLDVDILLFGSLAIQEPGFVVPHPRLHERRFVLAPLAEIAPAVRHPVLGRTAAELLDTCPDRAAVRPFSVAAP
jgi:2-amino-4-hydroxy-6-hydroxymethyldihydropteridine diphosphokinase